MSFHLSHLDRDGIGAFLFEYFFFLSFLYRFLSLPLKLSPIWQTRSIPVVTTDVHRSTNRRNKIPNYPWKKHDKIVRNWHPSSHLHTRPPILHSLHRPVSNQCLTSQRFFPLLYSFFFPSREIKQCLTVKTRGKMRLEGFDIATEITGMDGKDDACRIYRSTWLPGFVDQSLFSHGVIRSRRRDFPLSFCHANEGISGGEFDRPPLTEGTFARLLRI